MKINKFLPAALLYFFINPLGLPFGLSWMVLLAPLLYAWILLKRKQEVVLPFLVVLFPFIFVHTVFTGVDLKVYGVSLIYFTMVYIFCQAFYTFLKECRDPEPIFQKILVINLIFCVVGIVLYFTPWDYFLWSVQNLTSGIDNYRRFSLFTYEPSIYATIFVPVLFFYTLQYFLRQNKIRTTWLLLMLILPLVLSFSIGVIGGGLLALGITVLVYPRQLLVKRRVVNAIISTGAMVLSVLFVLVFFFRSNTLFIRIANIFAGSDTSARGRTADSYILAKKILEEKNEWWGVGLGQVKLIGHDIVAGYYLYVRDFTATIPNVMADTWAVFGWWGIILRLGTEISLFFYTKVWTNYYRLMLFIFMFIYQFTGSFLTNLAEYVIWILAFTNAFPQFDAKTGKKVSPVLM